MLACALCAARSSVAAERVQLRNGFTLDCDHHEAVSVGRVQLVIDPANRIEVDASSILSVETVDPRAGQISTNREGATASTVPAVPFTRKLPPLSSPADKQLTPAELAAMVASAGTARNINVDLLQSVMLAESGGHVHAVSRTGAQGLMQLMPATAHGLGVENSFAPEQNLRGGATYLDALLTRYHNNLVLALAAYNAGPGAVDRYHGVPPYRETIAYVSRIVREFNRRTLTQQRHAALVAGAKLP